MKRNTLTLLIGIFLLTACGQTPSATQTLPIPVVEQATSTPSPYPTATQTFIPSATRATSITPLPTIPTFTPTFDVSTIITVTPAPKAECPKETGINEILLPQPKEGGYPSDDIVQPILNFLNSGGNIDVLKGNIERLYDTYSPKIISVDITNDGTSEIILDGVINEKNFYSQDYVLACNNGQFINLDVVHYFEKSYPSFPCCIVFVEDLNADGIPEVVTRSGAGSGGLTFVVYGWNEEKLVLITELLTSTFTDEKIQVERNGLRRLIVISKESKEIFKHLDQTIRDKTITLIWNGNEFSTVERFSVPRFRFQAIQDADSLINNGFFQDAISLYQDAIFSDKLDWWSIDRFVQQFQINYLNSEPTPTLIAPDTTEYPRLAAYAYYRIILLHLAQNHESDAGTVYNTLLQKFGDDPYGRPYVEMATAFWEAYQSTHKIYDGCAAAIQYAVEHPEILTPLGSDYHGSQSHTYVPEDVCPFR